MINTVSIKTVDCVEGRYDVFFDGVQVADKIDMVNFFMEAGKIPHMIISASFFNLEIDGVSTDIDIIKPDQDEISGDIQHVSYDDSQLGRDK